MQTEMQLTIDNYLVGCKYCTEIYMEDQNGTSYVNFDCENMAYLYHKGKWVLVVADTLGCSQEIDINACPKCGRILGGL